MGEVLDNSAKYKIDSGTTITVSDMISATSYAKNSDFDNSVLNFDEMDFSKRDEVEENLFSILEELGYSFDEEEEEYVTDEALATILGLDSPNIPLSTIEQLTGNLSDNEYKDMISDIEAYYQQYVDYYQSIEDETNSTISDLIDLKISMLNKWESTIEPYRTNLDGLIEQAYLNHEISEEDYLYYVENLNYLSGKTDNERYEWVKDHFDTDSDIVKNYKSQADIVEEFNNELLNAYHELGYGEEGDPEFSTFEEFMDCMTELYNLVDYAVQYKNVCLNKMDSAQFDYLQFKSDYETFSEIDISSPTEEEINAFYQAVGSINGPAYAYQTYKEIMGDCSPDRFIMIAKTVLGDDCDHVLQSVPHYEDIMILSEIAKYDTTLLKAYNYAIYEGKEEEFFKIYEDKINNWQGQFAAAKFLEKLDSYEDLDELIKNLMVPEEELSDEMRNSPEYLELKELLYPSSVAKNEVLVSGQGLADGLGTAIEGAGYSIEAFMTIFGISKENRTHSSEEYKKMYILYALISDQNKKDANLLIDGENGELINARKGPIDFTQNYVGPFLSNNYEISQGIGNMLPSVILSYFNPLLGSIAMGVSAGGNSYHGAMVDNHSLLSSFMYGVVNGFSESVSERILGGLPFLSDTNVTNWKSFINAMRKETNQEMFQGVFDYLYRWGFMGEEPPQSEKEWLSFAEDIGKQGLYGGITAGIMNLPSWAISSLSRVGSFDLDNDLYSSGSVDGNNQGPSDTQVWKDQVYKSKFSKEIDGVKLVSDSKEGLNQLESYYKAAINNSTDSQVDLIKKQGLIITNIKAPDSNTSFCLGNIVYMIDKDINMGRLPSLNHELTHFLDGYVGKNVIKNSVQNAINSLKNNHAFLFTNNYLSQIVQDINSRINHFSNQNVDQEISKILSDKYPGFDKFHPSIKNELFYFEKNLYIINNIEALWAISDIYDALSNGKMRSDFDSFGHGTDYYNRNVNNAYKEIIANVGLLMNTGQEQLLFTYFPASVADQLIHSYVTLKDVAAIQQLVKNTNEKKSHEYVQSMVEYISDVDQGEYNDNFLHKDIKYTVGNMSYDSIALYVFSPEVMSDYLNYCSAIITKKYGNDAFNNFITEFNRTGDPNCLPEDGGLRTYFINYEKNLNRK